MEKCTISRSSRDGLAAHRRRGLDPPNAANCALCGLIRPRHQRPPRCGATGGAACPPPGAGDRGASGQSPAISVRGAARDADGDLRADRESGRFGARLHGLRWTRGRSRQARRRDPAHPRLTRLHRFRLRNADGRDEPGDGARHFDRFPALQPGRTPDHGHFGPPDRPDGRRRERLRAGVGCRQAQIESRSETCDLKPGVHMIRLLALVAALLLAVPAFAQPVALPARADPQNTLIVDTTQGRIVIKLRNDIAPGHAARIKQLAREGFYNGVPFHRVIAGFMAQTGDGQNGNGTGGSKYPDLKAEFSNVPFKRGTVGMARKGNSNDSANSQWFIMFADGSSLNGQYTVIGEVLSGMDVVDKIKKGEPVQNPDKMTKVQVAADAK